MHKNCGYLIPSNKGLYALHLGNLLNQPIFTMSLRQIRLSELKQSPELFTRWFLVTYFSGKNYIKWDKHRPVFQSGTPAFFQHCRKSWAGQFIQAWRTHIPVHHSVIYTRWICQSSFLNSYALGVRILQQCILRVNYAHNENVLLSNLLYYNPEEL